MASEFDNRHLEAEADSEEGDSLLAGVLNGFNLPFDSSTTEAGGDDEGVDLAEDFLGGESVLQRVAFDPLDVDLGVIGNTGVDDRFTDGLVGVAVAGVLADDGDGAFVLGVLEGIDQGLPFGEVDVARFETESLTYKVSETGIFVGERDFVDRFDVHRLDNGLRGNAAEEGDLVFHVLRHWDFGSADEHVRGDADFAKFVDRVLGGFGLDFAPRSDGGDQGDVDVHSVLDANVGSHLSDGFEEREGFDVTDGAADLGDHNIGLLLFGEGDDGALDFVGDVGDDLNGATQVVATALGVDDVLVDLAGGDAGACGAGDVHEALVVAEVEVGFRTVIRDEDFTMLERVHGASIDVNVRIKLEGGDGIAAVSEESAKACGRNSFSNRAHDAAGHKYIFRQDPFLLRHPKQPQFHRAQEDPFETVGGF